MFIVTDGGGAVRAVCSFGLLVRLVTTVVVFGLITGKFPNVSVCVDWTCNILLSCS